MNSYDLIQLHRDHYPKSVMTPETVDTILYQLMKLTSQIEGEEKRAVLIRATAYELVYRNYSGPTATTLHQKVAQRFDVIYNSSLTRCCLLFC